MAFKEVEMEQIDMDCHAGGVTISVDGPRGHGKSHLLDDIIETGLIGGDKKTQTNMIYKKLTSKTKECTKCKGNQEIIIRGREQICDHCGGNGFIGLFKQDYPKGIQKTIYLSDIFRNMAVIREKDPWYINQIVLDEVQNFAFAYNWHTPMSKTLSILQGDARKWNANFIFATPIYEGIPAMLRRYTQYHYFKNQPLTQHYNKIWNTNYHKRKGLVFLEGKDIKGILPLIVPVANYNRKYKDMKTGDYTYDHLASGFLTEGPEWFTLEAFQEIYCNETEEDIPQVTLGWMEDMKDEFDPDKQGKLIKKYTKDQLYYFALWIYHNTGGIIRGKPKGGKNIVEFEINARTLSDLMNKKVSKSKIWEGIKKLEEMEELEIIPPQ